MGVTVDVIPRLPEGYADLDVPNDMGPGIDSTPIRASKRRRHGGRWNGRL